jgi:hypothetical protein
LPFPSGFIAPCSNKDSGSYDAPLAITLHIGPSDKTVSFAANRVTKEYANGFIVAKVTETLEGTVSDDQTLTLPTDGMWEVFFSAAGAADDIKKTY